MHSIARSQPDIAELTLKLLVRLALCLVKESISSVPLSGPTIQNRQASIHCDPSPHKLPKTPPRGASRLEPNRVIPPHLIDQGRENVRANPRVQTTISLIRR